METSNLNPDSQTAICQYCKNGTPEEFNFCILCENQIKCLECQSQIYPGKNFCLKCAAPLAKKPAAAETPNHYLRKVEQKGKDYSEHTEFSLSNEAVKEIAPFVIKQTLPNYQLPAKNQTRIPNPNATDAEFVDETENNGENGQSSGSVLPAAPPNAIPDKPNANGSSFEHLFTKDGEYLIPKKTDFKGDNWADQQRNFLTLYIQAHNETFQKPVPNRDHLKNVAVKTKIADPNNFPNILSKFINAKVQELSTGLILNDEGEKDARTIVALINDENAKPGYSYLNRTSANSNKVAKLSKEAKAKIEAWVNETVDLDKLDIRLIATGRDAALLGLWVVTKHIKKAEALLWNETMHYLKSKYKELRPTPEAVSKAFSSKDNADVFQKNNDGQYFLSPEGEKLVNGWIDGSIEIKNKKEE